MAAPQATLLADDDQFANFDSEEEEHESELELEKLVFGDEEGFYRGLKDAQPAAGSVNQATEEQGDEDDDALQDVHDEEVRKLNPTDS